MASDNNAIIGKRSRNGLINIKQSKYRIRTLRHKLSLDYRLFETKFDLICSITTSLDHYVSYNYSRSQILLCGTNFSVRDLELTWILVCLSEEQLSTVWHLTTVLPRCHIITVTIWSLVKQYNYHKCLAEAQSYSNHLLCSLSVWRTMKWGSTLMITRLHRTLSPYCSARTAQHPESRSTAIIHEKVAWAVIMWDDRRYDAWNCSLIVMCVCYYGYVLYGYMLLVRNSIMD